MAAFIFDASAVVKRYLKEIGSGWIHGLADPAAISADQELNAAAIAEGLTVDNPVMHP